MNANRNSAGWILVPLALLVMLSADGCTHTDSVSDVDDDIVVYFREGDLTAMTHQELPTYAETEPGESALLARAFEGAPPQIPHTVEDMLPILPGENECMECHHPENVLSEDEKPLPESHFENAIMVAGGTGDPLAWKVSGYRKGEDVAGSRYNCSMCHTPQAMNVRTPRNLLGAE
jgi:cytochrome c-type protein NapB